MYRTTLAMLSTTAAIMLAPPLFASEGEEILATVCAACHTQGADGKYSRIDAARRTPEGWEMNVVRMIRNYGINLGEDERIAVIRHLADTRGLSIEETEGFRYILEREPNATDTGPTQVMTDTCGRCHSYARVALQRHTGEDWEKLINFHMGQFPSLEYQALARDRDVWASLNGEVLEELTKRYVMGEAPAKSDADLSGEWRIAGAQPGRGAYDGTLSVTADGDGYNVTQVLNFANGDTETRSGAAYLYGAGEWRATMTAGEDEIREVMALRGDGSLEGRWFDLDQAALGGRIHALRSDAAPQILSVSPDHIRSGETAELRISGVGLTGDVTLPDGLTAEVISSDPGAVVLRVTAAEDAANGRMSIAVGDAALVDGLAVYDALDRISVEPGTTFARIGGNDGPIPKQPAVFDAVGWLNGPDGQPGTEDDIRVGVVKADWSLDNFDQAAADMDDLKFAGSIDDTGMFHPEAAGPNPDRIRGTNNTGNLAVIATVTDQDNTLEGRGHLYATVQTYANPPIR